MGQLKKRGRTWWIRYYRNGKRHEESSGSTKEGEAKRLLRLREGDIERGVATTPKVGRIRFEEAAADVINDCRTNRKRSLVDVERRIEKHLKPVFGGRRMTTITTADIREYVARRQAMALEFKPLKKGDPPRTRPVSNAEINRELTVLKRMIAYCRSLPRSWREYDKIAKQTAKGWGIHAAVLDIDVGPLLQVQKLLDSVQFARIKGYTAPLTAAELELMNLTGDGNGIDMVMMPQDFRERIPTANFFQPNGYARNPVARRTKVVAGLVAEIQQHMDRNAGKPGAQEMAAAY